MSDKETGIVVGLESHNRSTKTYFIPRSKYERGSRVFIARLIKSIIQTEVPSYNFAEPSVSTVSRVMGPQSSGRFTIKAISMVDQGMSGRGEFSVIVRKAYAYEVSDV